jgi:diaminohydroxyphosphoribosylaminopyrimidine deaminase/5-amino-6-(5-phosphoribosylamino)uracil reductase
MQRCLQLAGLGAGYVAPNPMVGAILVHEGNIIGEGYHKQYGDLHAEPNCINNVPEDKKHLIPASTLYVSLEPCAHFGKTPPCADLIIKNKIKKVVVGCRDPFGEVNGKGIDKLCNAGIEVILGEWENECKELNKRFFTFHTQHFPYIVLKWAQTANGKIAAISEKKERSRLFISNEYTRRLVHKWRSEEQAILVGANTALTDNPSLTNRLWNGRNPVRMVIDRDLSLPASLALFNKEAQTIIFNTVKHEEKKNLRYYRLANGASLAQQICDACRLLNIQSVLIEGGTQLLQLFIDAGLWSECRIITNEKMYVENGLAAPELNNALLTASEHLLNDRIDYFRKK